MSEHSNQAEDIKLKPEKELIRTNGRNNSIEGLRGVSIIVIVTYHLLYKFTINYAANWPGVTVLKHIPLMNHFGEFGVSIFLVISSYFLYSGKTKENSFSVTAYFKAKIIRLWPAYAMAVSLTFIVTLILPMDGYQRSFSDYFLNITWINGFIGTPYIDGAHWYMTALVSFIVVVGFLRFLRIDHKVETYLMWVCVAGGFKAISEIIHRTINIQPLELLFSGMYKVLGGGFVGIACIGIVYHIVRDRKYALSKKEWLTVIILVGVCIAYTIAATNIWRVIFLLPALLLMELCLREKATCLNTKGLVCLGVISYPLYLIHQQVGYSLEQIMMNLNNGDFDFIFFIVTVLIVLMVAVGLYKTNKLLIRNYSARRID